MSLNQSLKDSLEQEFKSEGIVAFSNCCRWGCTGAYDEDDGEFSPRQKGIFYIRLHLEGMNYDPAPTECYAQYTDFDYVMENWDKEVATLHRWCRVVGLEPDDYVISKPTSGLTAIGIHFKNPLALDGSDETTEEESEEIDPKSFYRPTLYQNRMQLSTYDYKECPITKTSFEPDSEIAVLSCGHYFDSEAIDEWLKDRTCPLGRCTISEIATES